MDVFFELIQVALGLREGLSRRPSDEEWAEIYELSQKQAIAGYLFAAIDKLSKLGPKPPSPLLYEWIALVEQIKQRNILLNRKCVELMRMFEDAGFESCILKGQGNAMLYDVRCKKEEGRCNMALLRQPGDIDIWVKGKRDEIIGFCRSKAQDCDIQYHHIQFPIWEDVDVEVHFMPSYTEIPRYAKRTKAFFEKFEREEIDGRKLMSEQGGMYVPSKEMNLVFQMSHMARHFFGDGVGMRQIMDYYYLLKYTRGKVNIEKVVDDLRNVGLYRFAGAVMWVLKEVFAAEDELLIVPVDEKRGKLLLDEIMKGGNFGHHDKRVSARMKKKSSTLARMIRNLRLVRLFPEEALWTPIMGVWYYLKCKGD